MSYGNTILAAAAFGFLLAIYCMAGEMDYQDAVTEEQHTCAMVSEGKWPAAMARNFNCADPVQVAGVEHE